MECDKQKKERFSYEGFSAHCFRMMNFKGTIQGKDVSIYLCPNETQNFINIELANQISISELMIFKKQNILW